MRHLGKVTFAFLIAASAMGCAMYDTKPQKMRSPPPIKPPKDLPADPAIIIVDLPDCELRQVDMPVPKANAKTQEQERMGDARADVFVKSSEFEVKKGALIDLVDSYGRALAGDPFNPDLTLKLALAYDKAQRKGCALALLGRLAKLSDNPKFAKKTGPVIEEVVDKKTYFDRYRKEAIRAVGR